MYICAIYVNYPYVEIYMYTCVLYYLNNDEYFIKVYLHFKSLDMLIVQTKMITIYEI
jgi:hypothetical protein